MSKTYKLKIKQKELAYIACAMGLMHESANPSIKEAMDADSNWASLVEKVQFAVDELNLEREAIKSKW